MKKMLLKLLMKQRTDAYIKNSENILKLLKNNKNAKLLDLGCNDGLWTLELAKKINTKKIYGIELIKERAKLATKKGIDITLSDLNNKLPYKDKTFDVVHANQVIEHLNNTDLFLSEIHRILKKNGYAIISTENLASWHNIFALILGYTPFSLTNISEKTGALGNPLAPHHGMKFWEANTWQHQRVFTTYGLGELAKLHGFKVDKILSSGYYPFGNFIAKIDHNHSAFIALKLAK